MQRVANADWLVGYLLDFFDVAFRGGFSLRAPRVLSIYFCDVRLSVLFESADPAGAVVRREMDGTVSCLFFLG